LNQTARFTFSKFFLTLVVLFPFFIIGRGVFDSKYTEISEAKNYSIDEKKDIFNTFDMEDQIDQGLPIDPFDLMNRLKQADAMNNATTPSDALDEALNAFDKSEYENFQKE
jgi:hypothetical protein